MRDKKAANDIKLVVSNEVVYMGPERRKERRRDDGNERIETLLRNFGLDKRGASNRRKEGTSWLLTSENIKRA